MSDRRRCTAETRAGRQCRAWAVHGTEPPRCPAHGPKGPSGEVYPTFREDSGGHGPRNGLYEAHFSAAELAALLRVQDAVEGGGVLADEIDASRVMLRRLLAFLQQNPDLNARELAALASLIFSGSRAIARLLRDERALSGEAADGISGAIAQALDELATEWGVEI